jgi:predicted metal-dependent hydrolase
MGKRTLSLPTGDVEVEIIRSSRRTVALYVRPGGTLVLRAPWLVPAGVLMRFAAGKAGWIEKQLNRLKSFTPPGTPVAVTDGGVVPFMGRQLTVKVTRGTVRRASHDQVRLILTARDGDGPEELAGMAEAWYLREAKSYLPVRTRELATAHSALLPAPGTVSVRKMRRRWGTCHSGGAIWLNRELMKKDPELIDYVIIHELCHLVHHNHGKEYYALLGRIIPDFREKRRRLNQH